MNKTIDQLESSLGYQVGRVARSLGARLNRDFAEAGFDVTCEQWSVLVNLAVNNGQTQQELAAHTCKDKTSMTRLIDNMEKHDLVLRVPDKQDKRRKLIYLTHRGKEWRQRLAPIVERMLLKSESGIKSSDMNLCKKVLSQVYANLCEPKNVASATKAKDVHE